MAWTVAVLNEAVYGNHRVRILSCSADAAEAAVDTGLKTVYGCAVAPVSMTTASLKINRNKGSTGTALAGYLGITGVANGDVFVVTVFGS